MVEVPQLKIEAIHSQLKDVVTARVLAARSLASITGKLISVSIALGPVTRLITRSLYALINMRQSWCQTLVISPEVNAVLCDMLPMRKHVACNSIDEHMPCPL